MLAVQFLSFHKIRSSIFPALIVCRLVCVHVLISTIGSQSTWAQGDIPCDFDKPGSSLAKWYPDGKSLIFHRSGTKSGIYKINADGDGLRLMIAAKTKIGHPSVAPDNETILYQRRNATTGKDVLVLSYRDGKERILTDSLYNSTDGSLHPEGTWLAYAGLVDDNLDIYLLQLNGSVKMRLTYDVGYDYSPHWSPDGSKLIFTSHRDGGPNIFMMEADGSHKINLTPGNREEFSASWAPDGRRVVYSSRAMEVPGGKDPNIKHNSSDLYILDLENKTSTRVTQNSDLDVLPHWSPDGKRIAFTTCKNGNREIAIIDENGLNFLSLTKTDE